LEAHSLLMVGERERARLILTPAIEKLPEEPGVQLCMANTYARINGPGSEQEEVIRLQLINRLFEKSNVARLERIDPDRPLELDNLHAPSARASIPLSEQPMVSVLVPAYAAQETLHIALNGLLNQTWQQLEIIVIDDRSPDRTFEIAREYAHRDSRVVALQMDENGGSYASRNFGLRHANGAFITVHDADDWSHPQKIEIQARHLVLH